MNWRTVYYGTNSLESTNVTKQYYTTLHTKKSKKKTSKNGGHTKVAQGPGKINPQNYPKYWELLRQSKDHKTHQVAGDQVLPVISFIWIIVYLLIGLYVPAAAKMDKDLSNCVSPSPPMWIISINPKSDLSVLPCPICAYISLTWRMSSALEGCLEGRNVVQIEYLCFR